VREKIHELKVNLRHRPSVTVVSDGSTAEQLRHQRTRAYSKRDDDYDQSVGKMEILVPQSKMLISHIPMKYPLLRLIRTLSKRSYPIADLELP
jgi:hypothetical protein